MPPVVVVAVDLSHERRDAEVGATAARLAVAENASLHLANVIPEPQETYVRPYIPLEMIAEVERTAQSDFEALVVEIARPGLRIETLVTRGPIYVALIDVATRLGASVLVIGAHRPQLVDLLLGPNSSRVARHAPCSVYIAR